MASASDASGDLSVDDTGVASPCTGVCTMEVATELCIGCGRTLDEIATWSSLDQHDRRAIVDSLPARRFRHVP